MVDEIVLGLPGRNPATEAWMNALLDALGVGASRRVVARYRHWDGGSPDVAWEARAVAQSNADVVVAKSMGTMVAVAALAQGLRPRLAVLIGMPLVGIDDARRGLLREYVEQVPALFVQQENDIVGSFADLEAVIGGFPQASLASVPGSDHVYSDIEALRSIICPAVG